MNEDEQLKKWVQNQDSYNLVKYLFDFELTEGQEQIVNDIVFSDDKRLCISAYTRYGKTETVAISILLFGLLNKDKTCSIVGPQRSQAKKLRDYIGHHIVKCPWLRKLVDIDATGIERLKKEVTKNHITFKNNYEIFVLSAAGEADRLMGEGASGLLIIDESCLIDEEVYNKKISRMLGDDPDAKEVQISNPWHKDNHFYKAWESERYKSIHVDYEQGLDEDRITESFIEEQREKLTDQEFKILYDSEFPDQRERGLFKYSWVHEAVDRELSLDVPEIIYGLDVAEKGEDKTVLTKAEVEQDSDRYNILDIEELHSDDTMDIVNLLREKIEKDQDIFIDSIGIGAGVYSRLDELNYKAHSIRVSKAPNNVYDEDSLDSDRFSNQKAQHYWHLRNLFEDGRISIPDSKNLRDQLTKLKYEMRGKGNISIEDPSKSPDYADSLMLCCSKEIQSEPGVVALDW